jgi:hypothetical protein
MLDGPQVATATEGPGVDATHQISAVCVRRRSLWASHLQWRPHQFATRTSDGDPGPADVIPLALVERMC